MNPLFGLALVSLDEREREVPSPLDHPCHTFRRDFLSSTNEITFILSTFIVHYNYKFTIRNSSNGILDSVELEWRGRCTLSVGCAGW